MTKRAVTKRWLTIAALALAAIAAVTLDGCADNTPLDDTTFGSLRFQITDAAGNPLAGAKVVSNTQPAGQLKVTGMTDSSGEVAFNSVVPGEYQFYVSRFDYVQKDLAVTVTPGPLENINVELESSIQAVTFEQLVAAPGEFNGKTVTIRGFWFDGFEIVVLAERLEPSNFAAGNVQPAGALIWVKGGLPENISRRLTPQPDNPTGYPAHFSRLELTGLLEYGGRYGHLGAYQYQLTVQATSLLSPTTASA